MTTKPRGGSVSADKLQAENEFLRRGGFAEEIGKTVRVLLICLTSFGIVYLGGHAIEALAGKETDANILVSMIGTVEISMMLSWVFGAGGIAYGKAQQKLRKSTVERLHGRIESLEAELDPKRTSSKLTKRGDTNPEDE